MILLVIVGCTLIAALLIGRAIIRCMLSSVLRIGEGC